MSLDIAITGASGLVGTALTESLQSVGHRVRRLVRRAPGKGEVHWDPIAGKIDVTGLAGVDAVVHLAGESIAEGRWTAAKKQRIAASRVDATKLLSEVLASLDHPPRVMLSASAIGFYGDRGEATVDEQSAVGEGFLPEVCRDWESATAPASEAGVRVVNMRIGVVISERGGALKKMLLPFKLGAGGILGTGRQFMSWIALDDLVGAIGFLLENESVRGPVNLVSPQAVTNREFTKSLGKVLHRPTIMPMPSFAAKLAFGEMADALLLTGAHVVPSELEKAGYAFRYPELESALRHVLGRA